MSAIIGAPGFRRRKRRKISPNTGNLILPGAVAWYDASEEATLWQDSAGTIPVTATGQTVNRIDDLTGNGNHLKNVDGFAPTWEESGGFYYLEWASSAADGVLYTDTLAAIDGVESISIYSSWRPGAASNSSMAPALNNAAAGAGTDYYYTQGTGGATAFQYGFLAGRETWTPLAGVAGVDCVWTQKWNGPGTDLGGGRVTELRRNGAILTYGGVATAFGDTVTACDRIRTGLFVGPLNSICRCYGFAVYAELHDSDDVDFMEAYMATLNGVTLP